MANQNIFRKEAIENFSSPEQLDTVMSVLKWHGWVALFAVGLLLLIGVAWSFLGSIKMSVSGRGMMMAADSMIDSVSATQGMLNDIKIKMHQTVNANDLLATLHLPELESRIIQNKSQLHVLQQKKAKLASHLSGTISRKNANAKESITLLDKRISYLEGHIEFLSDRLKKSKTLVERKLVVPLDVFEVQKKLDDSHNMLNSAELEKLKITNDLDQLQSDAQRNLLDLQLEIDNVAARLDTVQTMYEQMSQIRAPAAGTVIEISAEPGQFLSVGDSVAILATNNDDSQAIIFFYAEVGQQIKSGMTAFVYPATVQKEEYGGIVAKVEEVSDYIVSDKRLVTMLQNKMFSQHIRKENPALIAVKLKLEKAQTASGYKWSSSDGPDTPLKIGAMCHARVITKVQHPITFVVPFVKHLVGIE